MHKCVAEVILKQPFECTKDDVNLNSHSNDTDVQNCHCQCILRIFLKLQLGAIKAGLQAKKCAATCTCHRLG